MKKNLKNIVVSIVVVITLANLIGKRGHLVEELNIPNAIGYDLDKKGVIPIYSTPIRAYFQESKQPKDSKISIGEAITVGETRSDRQLKSNKEFLLGLEKVAIIGEKQARYGIANLIDILINNPQVNDRAKLVVCRGKAKDMLDYEVKNYSGADEYIGDLVEHSTQFNFFTNRNTLMDFIILASDENKIAITPYLQLDNEGIKVIGLAVFSGTKLEEILGIDDAKVVNLLRPNSGRGIISIQKSSKEYINFYPRVKRKVKCYKEGSSYKFVIELNLRGDIVSNQLYKNMNEDTKILKRFQTDMEEHVQKRCDNFIVKMKKNCKLDLLDLSSSAIAKYGRNQNINWNEMVCNSPIEVKVKVRVRNQGRGQY